mgnify:FL=1|tara:strand:+ start:49 stop:924 length:876 start_codon:yes stop_codon:yes gene_type:complete
MKKIKHSKFKNTGILFELLVRQITFEVLNGDNNEKAQKILKEFYSNRTELGKELRLYQMLSEEKYKSEGRAEKFIDTILEARKRIDLKKLTKEKYNLVKKIQESFDIQQFLSSPITNYKVMASIYKIFESQNKENYDVKDVFNSKYTIVEGLIGGELENKAQLIEDKTISEFKTQNKEERFLTYRVLLENFNKKHRKLNESQKTLLKNYINNVSNTSKFKEYYTQQLKEVITQLVAQHKEIKDKVTKIKLKETINVLKKTKIGRVVSDNQVSAMMIAYELISEIKNVRNKA